MKNKQKRKKEYTPEQQERIITKEYFDRIAPGVVRFYTDHYICGNFYKSCWAVTEYPPTTEETAILAHLADRNGVTLRIYNRLVNSMEQRKIVQQAMRKNHMMTTTNDVSESVKAQDNINDVVELLSELRRNKEPLLHTAVFIELRATTEDKLRELQADIQMELTRSKISVDRLLLRQKEGFLAVLPCGNNVFASQFERVLPASSVANLYPLNYSGKTDQHGFYIGRDKYGSNVLVDFDKRTEDKTNSNVLILGNSGQGKSHLLKLLLCNHREAGKSVLVLDPESEYQELCANLGGTYIDMMSGEYMINPLEPKAWGDQRDAGPISRTKKNCNGKENARDDNESVPEAFRKEGCENMAQSQIIVTSRYLKSGSARSVTKRKNYTKYIATRETVEKREQNQYDPNTATTKTQKEMLSELLNDFPEAKRYLEYEDYTAHPTVQNASELITTIIERHADVIGNRQNFVGYMAKRPGAEQRGAHGLFNDSDEPIVLNQVADEVAHHKGNVWSHVVSLRREDAIRLGYDNSDRWRELVKRQIPVIAEQSRIPMSNLKWYAAFHDTTHHPHIHLIVYSTNPKQGYLSREGIDKIRSAFANDIFHDDLQSIYQEQTLSRDELKSISQEQVHQMVMQIQNSTFNNPQLEKLVKKLHEQLQTVSGKKVYGYLPQDVKRTVDDIIAELAKDKQISQLYEKWCELERLKYRTYTQKEPDIPPLADNKVFKPVKNMIIRAVESLKVSAMDFSAADSSGANDTEAEIVDDSMAAHLIFNMFVCLSNCIEADYNKKCKSLRISVDSKLRRVIQQRKRDLGIHEDHGQQIL